ncbi:cobalt-precorrin-6A reductase [Thermobifida fusca]|uniref:Precorrin-6A reductase n=2 Tax=Thermobifida fusca TaxID=2021 RepID=A0A9P2TCQ1_THEFU|nr:MULTISPECIES: cobalt-precorrin-6A reductase [Thermobifida]AAZ54348.1 precorrin-6A reductase [Thermobifida fusca YX]EOR72567.1 precorrin-6A reductase [Thermobifida fusca TM51]MBO2529791.1 cobalt-precorrin-6A reductase [Thermobifida sp.]MDD6791713.1 cobalt-precorrin-6A reductase [Thermobifida fusca]PPS95500.1 cobalt-precorrin-6X reductase [Thermobifida fusca]
MKVLILGGTAEARALAEAFVAAGIPVLSSLAGRVSHPRLPAGEVRIGGFGGAAGLAGFLRSNGITRVVDATHPFAIRVSTNAAEACTQAGVPLLRLVRPGWENEPAASRWIWVDDHDEAAWQAARLGRRVLLTTGRQTLHHFIGPLAEHTVLARVVEDVELALPPTWILIRSRGPYTCAGERKLMAEHAVEVLVTKDSGGVHTRAKLDAADELGVSVVVVRRPLYRGDVPTVADVPAALEWLGLSQTR